MSSTATIPAPNLLVATAAYPLQPPRPGRERRLTALTAAMVVTIIAVSLLIVIVTADRPSFLAPLTSSGFFPNWMAGPLGGLWPSLSHSVTLLQDLFTFGALLMYACYVGVLLNAHRLRARWLMAGVVVAHVVYFLSPPMTLTDVGNYINYGRMEIVHHLNPYVTIPDVEPHTDPAFLLSNWHHLLSPYGPLFTIITFALVPLGVAASFWTIKGILMLCSLAVVALVARSASLLGHDPRRAIAIVGLNPIVLMWGLGGDHNDPVTMLFIVTGVYLLLFAYSGRTRLAARRQAAAELERRLAAAAPPPPPMPAGMPGVHPAFAAGQPERLPLLGARLLIPPAAASGYRRRGRLRAGLRALLGRPGPESGTLPGFDLAAHAAQLAAQPRGRFLRSIPNGGDPRPTNGVQPYANGGNPQVPYASAANGRATQASGGYTQTPQANGGPVEGGYRRAPYPAAPGNGATGANGSNGMYAGNGNGTNGGAATGHAGVAGPGDTIAYGVPRPSDGADLHRGRGHAVADNPTTRFLARISLSERLVPVSAEFLAGVSLVLAVAVKASAGILLPVILLGLLRTPRRALTLFAGMAFAAIVMGVISYSVFGAHLPDISTQDSLVIAESVPNLIGLALGQGGETGVLHTVIQLSLVITIIGCSVWAWRRKTPGGASFLAPAGWATLALLMALSWVLPWYVIWLLPFAALARSRAFTRAVLIFGAYLIITWCPLASGWYSAIGFYPTSTVVGVQHAAENKALLH